MISLDQVQLLEARVAKAIEYVRRVTAENESLTSERKGLQLKLETNQRRIDELEVLVMRFKEDQSRIEDGIIAALDRLSQFEEAFEDSLKEKASVKKPAAVKREKPVEQVKRADPEISNSEMFFEIPENAVEESLLQDAPDLHSGEDSLAEGELDIF
ncbi:MAG: cell division protein ZapB [Treponema sp.]|nr:cell division protein ZapB [Treponema sp.]